MWRRNFCRQETYDSPFYETTLRSVLRDDIDVHCTSVYTQYDTNTVSRRPRLRNSRGAPPRSLSDAWNQNRDTQNTHADHRTSIDPSVAVHSTDLSTIGSLVKHLLSPSSVYCCQTSPSAHDINSGFPIPSTFVIARPA